MCVDQQEQTAAGVWRLPLDNSCYVGSGCHSHPHQENPDKGQSGEEEKQEEKESEGTSVLFPTCS